MMKKCLVILFVFMITVSAISCGNTGATSSAEDPKYEKYSSIIDKLEAEDYDGAIKEIESMKPAPVRTEVEITKENFFDYYDVVFRKNGTFRDAYGKIGQISRCDELFDFVLKDGYTLDLHEDNKIEIGVTAEYDLRQIKEVNFDTAEILLGDEVFDDEEVIIVLISKEWTEEDSAFLSETCKGSQKISCGSVPYVCMPRWTRSASGWEPKFTTLTPKDHEGYFFFPSDISIVRAEGTLHFISE